MKIVCEFQHVVKVGGKTITYVLFEALQLYEYSEKSATKSVFVLSDIQYY